MFYRPWKSRFAVNASNNRDELHEKISRAFVNDGVATSPSRAGRRVSAAATRVTLAVRRPCGAGADFRDQDISIVPRYRKAGTQLEISSLERRDR